MSPELKSLLWYGLLSCLISLSITSIYLGITEEHIPLMVVGLGFGIITLYVLGGACIMSLKPKTSVIVNPLHQPINNEDPVIIISQQKIVKDDPDPVNVV
jgi:Na+-transporting methylmalonyl-CoA/oxaloacetate decarboxylase beta subunit